MSKIFSFKRFAQCFLILIYHPQVEYVVSPGQKGFQATEVTGPAGEPKFHPLLHSNVGKDASIRVRLQQAKEHLQHSFESRLC